MPEQVTNYQCPACTGPLHFSEKTGKLECDYCGSSYPVEKIEALYAKKEAAAAAAKPKDNLPEGDWTAEEAAHMRAYNCPSCGAQLVCDDSTAATSCPYCGNPTVVPGQFTGGLKPDWVIPFKMDKNAAVAALKEHYKSKFLLPRAFSAENHIEEIKGVYVPFWLYNAGADADLQFQGTQVESHREGDEEVTTTSFYRVVRGGHAVFRNVPADGSSKMPDAHMDAIEPFNYDEMKAFSTAYLPGFLADRYDVSAEDCGKRAEERMHNGTIEAFKETIGPYATLTPERTDVQLQPGKTAYALLPVWMLSTKWKDKTFLFAMNGQTGRLIGDLPVDWARFFMLLFGIWVPLSAIAFLLTNWL